MRVPQGVVLHCRVLVLATSVATLACCALPPPVTSPPQARSAPQNVPRPSVVKWCQFRVVRAENHGSGQLLLTLRRHHFCGFGVPCPIPHEPAPDGTQLKIRLLSPKGGPSVWRRYTVADDGNVRGDVTVPLFQHLALTNQIKSPIKIEIMGLESSGGNASCPAFRSTTAVLGSDTLASIQRSFSKRVPAKEPKERPKIVTFAWKGDSLAVWLKNPRTEAGDVELQLFSWTGIGAEKTPLKGLFDRPRACDYHWSLSSTSNVRVNLPVTPTANQFVLLYRWGLASKKRRGWRYEYVRRQGNRLLGDWANGRAVIPLGDTHSDYIDPAEGVTRRRYAFKIREPGKYWLELGPKDAVGRALLRIPAPRQASVRGLRPVFGMNPKKHASLFVSQVPREYLLDVYTLKENRERIAYDLKLSRVALPEAEARVSARIGRYLLIDHGTSFFHTRGRNYGWLIGRNGTLKYKQFKMGTFVVAAATQTQALLRVTSGHSQVAARYRHAIAKLPKLPSSVHLPVRTGERPKNARGRAGISWVFILGGSFRMGHHASYKDERPVHRVKVRSFQLARTEVTVTQYRACVRAKKCGAEQLALTGSVGRAKRSTLCNWGSKRGGDHPLNCVSWQQARNFCRWVGGRLPTEAEWEYAARGGGMAWLYPWGNETADCSRVVMTSADRQRGCGRNHTWPVCSKPKGHSEHGLCDLAGNVSEFVEDCWKPNYEGAPADGSARTNCVATAKVSRGGTWFWKARALQTTYRSKSTGRANGRGFRCAKDILK